MDIFTKDDAFQVQIEYALQAVASGAPSVGIKVDNTLILEVVTHFIQFTGCQRCRPGHREEEQVHIVRGSLDLQDRADH